MPELAFKSRSSTAHRVEDPWESRAGTPASSAHPPSAEWRDGGTLPAGWACAERSNRSSHTDVHLISPAGGSTFDALVRYVLCIPTRAGEAAAGRTPGELVGILRSRAGLGVPDLTYILDVSRRSIYTWVERGSLSRDNESRLTQIVHALSPLLGIWGPQRIRQWLHEGDPVRSDLLRQGLFEVIRDEAATSARQPSIPVRPALPVGDDAAEDVPLGAHDLAARQAFMAAFARPRPAPPRTRRLPDPPEITGMGGDEEE